MTRSMTIRFTSLIALAGSAVATAQQRSTLELDAPPTEEPAPRFIGGVEVPRVGSREEFFSLTRRDRSIVGQDRRPPITVLTGASLQFTGDAGLDDTGGSVQVSRVGAEIGFSHRLTDDSDFIFQVVPEFSFYDFEDAEGILPFAPSEDEPFDDVYSLTLRPVYRVNRFKGWSYLVGATLVSAGETSADFEDTLYIGGFGGASYWISDTLRIGFVITGRTLLEEGVQIIAFPTIEWRPNERFSLITGQGGLQAGYHFGNFKLAAEFGFENREYGLDRDGPLPGGSYNEFRFPAGVSLTYAPTQQFVISGRVGAMLLQSIEFNDAGGGEVADQDLESTIFGGLSIQIRF
ncbi:MAG: hypothetical protein AAGI17_04095 [Planctomycetota bacterium]